MQHDTAGDPVTGLRWTRKTTAKIAQALGALGLAISAGTVGRLLRAMGYSLRVNHKKVSGGSPETRDEQFHYIAELRETFARRGDPIVSVDSKKRELVGNFKNAGAAYSREPALVNDHDFRSIAEGIAIPYGVYDLVAKRGSVFVGTSYDTPTFAATCLEKWWRYDARHRYPRVNAVSFSTRPVDRRTAGATGPRHIHRPDLRSWNARRGTTAGARTEPRRRSRTGRHHRRRRPWNCGRHRRR